MCARLCSSASRLRNSSSLLLLPVMRRRMSSSLFSALRHWVPGCQLSLHSEQKAKKHLLHCAQLSLSSMLMVLQRGQYTASIMWLRVRSSSTASSRLFCSSDSKCLIICTAPGCMWAHTCLHHFSPRNSSQQTSLHARWRQWVIKSMNLTAVTVSQFHRQGREECLEKQSVASHQVQHRLYVDMIRK